MRIDSLLSLLDEHSISYQFKGDSNGELTCAASLALAEPNALSFLNASQYLPALEQTHAGLVILKPEHQALCPVACVAVDAPYYVYSLCAQALYPDLPSAYTIAASASLAEDVILPNGLCIEANAVIKSGVVLGQGCWIQAGAILEEGVQVGQGCKIGAGVVIHRDCLIGDFTRIESGTVIGGEGFGWAPHQGRWSRIPQVGRVRIGRHVSIGNNCCIDRGALEDTVIEDHCIIDNLVHIAHNVQIGEGSAIAGQVGFAGTTKLGKHNIVAGQAGFAGHLSTVDSCHFAAKTGVTHDIKQAGAFAGFPAQEAVKWQKQTVRLRQLDKMAAQMKAMQKQIDALQHLVESTPIIPNQ
ncbi:MAG: UDP-3-O-(3-hydroxymyristoyl)glucosamine N-acyltransferase [Thiotrichales bacterium]|nr:UDP-3-O-(3-hydroxymyristoyl)glucosamine N-acyltransferase [Thiotrichales bacterium]